MKAFRSPKTKKTVNRFFKVNPDENDYDPSSEEDVEDEND
jgi:hypothetical protein